MTKIDHEKLNRMEKSKRRESLTDISSTPKIKIARVMFKKNIKSKHASTPKLLDLRVPCDECNQKVLPKNMERHYFLCHELMQCPLCPESHRGQKKFGRHIKKVHGHNSYRMFKNG